jgi:soluble lytic murein transglycosylase-like protein
MGMMRTGRILIAVTAMLALSASCVAGRDADRVSPATAPAPDVSQPAVPPSSPAASPTTSLGPDGPSPRPARPFVPPPNASLPATAAGLADALARATHALRDSTAAWVASGDSTTRRPPRALVLQALYEQRIYRGLMRNPGLTREVVARLPSDVRTRARLTTRAMATLISGVRPLPSAAGFRTGPPPPPGTLLAGFHEAQRRFGVPWEVLAAVMYVESKFGRARSDSAAGAQGPMQFLPSTWAAYGMGGHVDDPHDAILGAANFLHANGAPGDARDALFAYNHSERYVEGVLLLAERLRREPASFVALYAWQVFVVTVHGDVRLTGPGRHSGP